jgi:2-polyprenyl-3-methyl-5-hydroxy-6-metoxy-1,4-benzoquinol methylase
MRVGMNCPVSDRGGASEKRRLYDDRFGYPGSFRLLACEGCRHRFLEAEFDSGQIERLYADYYPRRTYAADFKPLRFVRGLRGWWRGEASAAAYWVPRGVRVLDVGCGVGEALAYFVSRDCDAHGVEPDVNVRRITDSLGLSVRIGPFEATAYPPGSFDYVTLNQVLEHVPRPVETLRGVRTLLRPGGRVIVTTPNAWGWGARTFGARWIHWHAPYHLQHFSRRSMVRAAARAGLRVRLHRTICHPEWTRFQLIHCAAWRGPGRSSPAWSGSDDYTPWERRVVRLASLLSRLRMSQLTTRAFDAAGPGDSCLRARGGVPR